jgi:dTDP-4-amino-4,6-dideoxygalactose transaminase
MRSRSPIQAVILLHKLPLLDEWSRQRQATAASISSTCIPLKSVQDHLRLARTGAQLARRAVRAT